MMRAIQLGGRRGSPVRGHALVEDRDFSALGSFCWHMSDGYARRHARVGGRRRCVYLHREIMGLGHGDPREVDHKNGNRLDCRRGNLRIVSKPQNQQNRRGGCNASGYRGVYRSSSGKWRAEVHLCLGSFDTPEEAAAVVETWRAENRPFSQVSK